MKINGDRRYDRMDYDKEERIDQNIINKKLKFYDIFIRIINGLWDSYLESWDIEMIL